MQKLSSVTIAVMACACYSICSMAMTFTNKAVFSLFLFQFPLCLLMFQHIFTFLTVFTARQMGFITFKSLQFDLLKQWYPANVLFIVMLISGSYALKLLSVPMVTIFKNITTTLITISDGFFFEQQLDTGVLASVFLMVFGSIVAGFNDLEFNLEGYMWMTLNCVVSAGYVLYLRYAMKKTQLSEWGMVYYNNFLAIPTLLPLLFASGEVPQIFEEMGSFSKLFMLVVVFSGISGLLISVCSFWTIKVTSPTTYSIVGSLNKIPLTILGFVIFHSPVSTLGAISIFIALMGGVLYSASKAKTQTQRIEKPILPVKKETPV